MNTEVLNDQFEPNSRVQKLKQEYLHIAEKTNHDIKFKIWDAYETEEIESTLLSQFTSETEAIFWKAYRLGRSHGEDVANTESIEILINQENDMHKLTLELDNSHIPKRTNVNPNSWYLKFRRFYCKRKALINPLALTTPIVLYFILSIAGAFS